MIITIQLFAAAAEAFGARSLMLTLHEGTTVSDLRRQLSETAPMLDAMLNRSAIAVNQAYAEDELKITETDEVALIPPVSGG